MRWPRSEASVIDYVNEHGANRLHTGNAPPVEKSFGDIYYDSLNGTTLIYDGQNWIHFHTALEDWKP